MSANDGRSVCIVILGGVLLATSAAGCQSRPGVGPLPGPPAGDVTFSKSQPANPFTSITPGLFARTVYSADSGAGYRVEVRDLLVGPGQKASGSLPGAAVLEIRSGAGTMTVAGRTQELRTGSTLSLPDGQAFAIQNTGAGALTIRVHLLSGT